MLTSTYANVRRSIVAFGSKAVVSQSKKAPPFPTILGTGFVMDERGLVVTNRHVVTALEKLPKHPTTDESAAIALACSDVTVAESGVSMNVASIGLRRWDKVTSFTGEADPNYYGEPLPDIAFVQLNACGIPALSIESQKGSWDVGTPIGTAGYPLGDDALAIYGRINQVAPILRQGVIASAYPFPCPRPHGFTIDVMTLGGESGSPVFRASDGIVLGLLHAGFDNTNITLCIPSWLVAQAFAAYVQSVSLDFDGLPNFEELLSDNEPSEADWDSV